MPIEFRCPHCNQLLRTPDESAGKQARCPQCQQIAPVPVPQASAPEDLFAPPPQDLFGPPPKNPYADVEAQTPPQKTTTSDPFNPYAAPTAFDDTSQAAMAGGLSRRTIDLGEILNGSWKIFSEELGKCVAVGAIALGINVGVGVLSQIFSLVAQGAASTESAVGIALAVLAVGADFVFRIGAQTWLQLGLAVFSLKMARNRTGEINDLFAVGPYFWRFIVVTLLLGLLAFVGVALLIGLPAGVGYALAAEQGAAIGGISGAFLFMIAALIVMLTVFLAIYFIIDRGDGAVNALSSSAQFMRGNRVTAFAIMLLVGLGGALFMCVTCFIGVIFYMPFYNLVTAMIYLTATGQPHSGEQRPVASQPPFKGF